jgi:hypothetical protein
MIEKKFIGNSGKAKPQNNFISTHTLVPNGRAIERKDIEAGTARVKAALSNPSGLVEQPTQVVEEVKEEPIIQAEPEQTAEVEPDAIIIDKTEDVPAETQEPKRGRKGKGSK